MITLRVNELFARLKAGILYPDDIAFLEQTPADQFLAEFSPDHPIRFQERRWKQKWEYSSAQSLRAQLLPRRVRDSNLVALFLLPVYRKCVFLSGEGERITGLSAASWVAARPVSKPFAGLALTLGPGYKLDRGPDGWAIKPLVKRTVRLSEAVLLSRGWRFDHFGSPNFFGSQPAA